jgi:hypothetical protein
MAETHDMWRTEFLFSPRGGFIGPGSGMVLVFVTLIHPLRAVPQSDVAFCTIIGPLCERILDTVWFTWNWIHCGWEITLS